MLRLTISESQNIEVTLTEKTTLVSPYYLFVFTNMADKSTVKFIAAPDDDLSEYPERFNRYAIDEDLFADQASGQWIYRVYEQASSTNEDTTGLNEVENGRLDLVGVAEVIRTEYEPEITRINYGG